MISFSVQSDRVTKAAFMTTGTSGVWHINAMRFIALVMDGLRIRLLFLQGFATEHGTHEGALHPIRMSSDERASFGSFGAAGTAGSTFAFFSSVTH